MAKLWKQSLVAGAALLLAPTLAQAHTLPGNNGMLSGFTHPLFGWDHLLVMLAIGIWAAQQGGRALWRLPLVFVGVMTLGGIVGAAGVQVPGVEFIILLSVPVFGWMVLERAKVKPGLSAALVGFFAFFHGLAHGTEMPVSASVVSFALGFVAATLLLHGTGILLARLAVLVFAFVSGGNAMAQTATNSPAEPSPEAATGETNRLPTVTVMGRADSLLEVAESATQGTVGQEQLEERPRFRVGEILETVPGVITTQHAGGGKANQYFLRGFNLDHGTDFYTSLDGMPLNLPSHGHGQGYSDMNIVIPELVQRVNYEKGVYYAANGDFSSAGAAHLQFYQTLPQTIAIAEGGMYGFAHGVFAASPKVGEGNVLYGVEYQHSDGPWEVSDDYNKINGILTYSQDNNDGTGFSITARAYYGKWNSSDQVATSAVDDGLVPLFGTLDETTGGDSQRYSLQGEWHRADAGSATKVMAYGFYYDLDLFSNFTYFLTDTNRGDQFEQTDKRWTAGLAASHTLFNHWWGRDVENAFGVQMRNDAIQNGLYNTEARQRVDKTNSFDGTTLNATTRQDDILETSIGLYYQNTVQWSDKFRSVAALRGDVFNFDVSSVLPENSGDKAAVIGSPKLSLIFGPWVKTEIYVQGGLGFHSNDGRGVTTTVDPVNPGNSVEPAKPLVQTYGAEVGVRTLYAPGLQSTLSVWWLDIDSELLFVGDAGSTEASRPSRRYGVEWANYYTPVKWLTLDADFSFSYAHFRDDAPEGDHIPGSVGNVIAVGLTVHDLDGFFGSIRLRYFGPRPLTEDSSIESEATALLSAQVGYQFNKTWSITADIFNLLNNTDHDIDYYYDSRVRPGDAVVGQIHFHPVEPIQVRVALTARF